MIGLLFIGGPLDGERREVGPQQGSWVEAVADLGPLPKFSLDPADSADANHIPMPTYTRHVYHRRRLGRMPVSDDPIEIMKLDGLTDDEAIGRLLVHYRPPRDRPATEPTLKNIAECLAVLEDACLEAWGIGLAGITLDSEAPPPVENVGRWRVREQMLRDRVGGKMAMRALERFAEATGRTTEEAWREFERAANAYDAGYHDASYNDASLARRP